MVVYKGRERADDVEIRGPNKRGKKKSGLNLNEWSYLMSPTPIAPTSNKFEPNLTVGTNYSYTSFTKDK